MTTTTEEMLERLIDSCENYRRHLSPHPLKLPMDASLDAARAHLARSTAEPEQFPGSHMMTREQADVTPALLAKRRALRKAIDASRQYARSIAEGDCPGEKVRATAGIAEMHADTALRLLDEYTPQQDGDTARLESWLALSDNALLDLEEGRTGDAQEKLMRVVSERIDGGWSTFDYPRQITALTKSRDSWRVKAERLLEEMRLDARDAGDSNV